MLGRGGQLKKAAYKSLADSKRVVKGSLAGRQFFSSLSLFPTFFVEDSLDLKSSEIPDWVSRSEFRRFPSFVRSISPSLRWFDLQSKKNSS